MSNSKLPERASLEYLKKRAKERLEKLRHNEPGVKLATALLAIAREYGFSSWRQLKAEVERRRAPKLEQFFRASAAGDADALRELLKDDGSLVRERSPEGNTALHLAVRHPETLRLLIEHGADPNTRDTGDNAGPLHLAAAAGQADSIRILLDAGADVHGAGDLHNAGVIGWAARKGNDAVIRLLLERGACHHIFSAMALDDLDLVERLVEENPDCLSRRRSRFESGHTPLHASFAPPDGLGFLSGKPNYAMLELLIELGADVEAKDDKGRTPLALAMLRGDHEAMRLLKAAGAREALAAPSDGTAFMAEISAAANSVKKTAPMFAVQNMSATLRWYESIGFTVQDRHQEGDEILFARLSFGNGEFAFSPGGNPGPRDVTLWFFTDRVQELYAALWKRQMRAAQSWCTRIRGSGRAVRRGPLCSVLRRASVQHRGQ